MEVVLYACRGALTVGGGLTLLQTLVTRQLRRPSGVAVAASAFVGTQ